MIITLMYKGLFHIYSFCSSITLWGMLDYVYNIIDLGFSNSTIMNLNTDSNIIIQNVPSSGVTTSSVVGLVVPTSVEDSSTRTRLIEQMYIQEKHLNELKRENTKLLVELSELKMTKLVLCMMNDAKNLSAAPTRHVD